jgi:hypothetical protein
MMWWVKLTYQGVPVTVYNGPYVVDDKPTEQALQYCDSLLGCLDALRQFASEELLDVYTDHWADADEPPMDRETFVTKLAEPEIALDAIGKAHVYFQDGDLFWGHTIVVRVEGITPVDAFIEG